jgi:hypothetical protein
MFGLATETATLMTQVWGSLGLEVLAVNVSTNGSGFVLDLSLGYDRQRQHQKPTRGIPNQTHWSSDDLNTPDSVDSARLDTVSLYLDFSNRSQQDSRRAQNHHVAYTAPLDPHSNQAFTPASQTSADGSSKLEHPSSTELGDIFIDLSSLATQLLLGNRAAELGQKVCNGYKRFDGSLATSLPSVFSSSYQLAVNQRAELCPWLSRSLSSFLRTSSQSRTGLRTSNKEKAPSQGFSQTYHEDMDSYLWKSLLTVRYSRPSTSVSLARNTAAGQGLMKQSIHSQLCAVYPANEIIEATTCDDMIVDPSLKACDDGVADYDLYVWDSERTTFVGEDHSATSHVEEPLPTKHMQLSSSGQCGEWDIYRMCNTFLESSQSSISSSDSWPSIEDTDQLLPEYEIWDDFIGPCDWLSQRPEAKDSQAECMLTERLSVQCAVNVDDLYESLFSFQPHGGIYPYDVTRLDRHPARSPVSATDQANLFDLHDSTQQVEVTNLEPNYDDPAKPTSGPFHDISAVIEQPLFDLLSSDNFDSGGQSNVEFDILATPEDQHHNHPNPILSTMKRSNTNSSSSSETSMTSRHSRRGSLLKMLAGNSSKVTDEAALQNINIELESIRDRSVVVKRRKTLDDYNTVNSQDEEMLFV